MCFDADDGADDCDEGHCSECSRDSTADSDTLDDDFDDFDAGDYPPDANDGTDCLDDDCGFDFADNTADMVNDWHHVSPLRSSFPNAPLSTSSRSAEARFPMPNVSLTLENQIRLPLPPTPMMSRRISLATSHPPMEDSCARSDRPIPDSNAFVFGPLGDSGLPLLPMCCCSYRRAVAALPDPGARPRRPPRRSRPSSSMMRGTRRLGPLCRLLPPRLPPYCLPPCPAITKNDPNITRLLRDITAGLR